MLSQQQLGYAASDVIHLHAIKEKLDVLLRREERADLARRVFAFVSVCAELDLSQTDYRYLMEH